VRTWRRRRSRRQGGADGAATADDEGEGVGSQRGEAARRRGRGVAARSADAEGGGGGRRRACRCGVEAAAEEAAGVGRRHLVGGPVEIVVAGRHRLGLGGGAVGGGARSGGRSQRLLRRLEGGSGAVLCNCFGFFSRARMGLDWYIVYGGGSFSNLKSVRLSEEFGRFGPFLFLFYFFFVHVSSSCNELRAAQLGTEN
jgi:hypothetical protein